MTEGTAEGRGQRRRDWLREKAAHPRAEKILAAVSFAESSVFPLPVDALYLPMLLSRPEKAWRLAAISTVFSVLGAALGYALGRLLFDAIGLPLLQALGHADLLPEWRAIYADKGAWAVLTAGITPFPFKVVTIVSGALQMNFGLFILFCLIARAIRYFAFAAAFKLLGHKARDFLQDHLTVLIVLVCGITLAGFFLL